MSRNDLTQILGGVEIDRLAELADRIARDSRVEVTKPASTSLVMVGVRESVQQVPFYLGEILISQCVVTVDGAVGYGFAMGEDLERAYCIAVLEAGLSGRHRLAPVVTEFLAQQTDRQKTEHRRDYGAILQTRVRFESMEEVSDATDN